MTMASAYWTLKVINLAVYFAPVLIGAVRRRIDPKSSWEVWKLFLVVALTGWTVIGWLVALRMAFRDKTLPTWLTTPSAGGSGVGSATGGRIGVPTFNPANAATLPNDAAAPSSCWPCGGSGTAICSPCSGQGHWYQEGQPKPCDYCGGRGQQTCFSCGGSGKSR